MWLFNFNDSSSQVIPELLAMGSNLTIAKIQICETLEKHQHDKELFIHLTILLMDSLLWEMTEEEWQEAIYEEWNKEYQDHLIGVN